MAEKLAVHIQIEGKKISQQPNNYNKKQESINEEESEDDKNIDMEEAMYDFKNKKRQDNIINKHNKLELDPKQMRR